ncbi:hypothetical protein [Cognatiyoonia sp. IB215182]|uniref:hypothetical protein n=1 Tax=Cognatiyoonia sp. IB215182 TaxID=3097353 RepID=UPI002A1709FA|nr:hypothetical protein [Cognatiyoonia sp. IB215182]MDX8354157.1 hypothetical protein [Cognatiyoonia sp. IB215182]
MTDVIPEWLADPLITSAMLGVGGFLLRGPIATYFGKAVDLKFEKSLEEAKSSIRANEKELDQITTFLTTRQNERQSIIEAKRLEAAETLLEAATAISAFAMFVEVMKVLKVEEVASSSKREDVKDFFKVLADGLGLDAKMEEFNGYDRTRASLYLSDKTLSHFDNYTMIMSYAAMFVKAMSLGLDATAVLREDALSKKVIEAVPTSKEGFEKYGEGYAYYWSQHFYDQLLTELRKEVSGSDNRQQDVETVAHLTASSIQAQSEARRITNTANLPQELFRDPSNLPSEAR